MARGTIIKENRYMEHDDEQEVQTNVTFIHLMVCSTAPCEWI